MYDHLLFQLNPQYLEAAFWSGIQTGIRSRNLNEYTDLDNTILGLYAIL